MSSGTPQHAAVPNPSPSNGRMRRARGRRYSSGRRGLEMRTHTLPHAEAPAATVTPDITIELVKPEAMDGTHAPAKVPRALEILVQCLHRYVEDHPEEFTARETRGAAGLIHTITLAKE
jgi:hypothetical protein